MGNTFEDEMVYWGTLAEKYLNAVKFIARRIVETGNPWVICSDASLSSAEYNAQTEANDSNLSIPTIYMFYHAIELHLKGGLSAVESLEKKNHDLGGLFEKFKCEFPLEKDLINTLSSFLDVKTMSRNNPVKKFCEINNITPSNFYEALRYPESRQSRSYRHWPLKYNEDDGVIFYKEIQNGCESLMKGFVALSRSRRVP